MKHKNATLAVQRWGNSLAVRIPAALARRGHFEVGTPVELTLHDISITITPIGERTLTLDERLQQFDPQKHGTEVMASGLIGAEKF